MPEPIREEIAAAAVVRENLATTPATRDEKLSAAVSKDLSEGLFTEALRKFGEIDDVDFDKLSSVANSLGTEVDQKTGIKKLTKQEAELKEKIDKSVTFQKKFLEGGYSKLSTSEKVQARKEVIEKLGKLPFLAEQIRTARAAGKIDALAERYLNNPAIVALLKEQLNSASEKSFDDSVLDFYDELQAKKGEQADVEAELAEIERRSRILIQQEEQFGIGQPEIGALPPTAIKEIRHRELTSEGARQTRTINIQTQTKELQEAQAEVRDLETRQAAELQANGQQRVDPRIRQFQSNLAGLKTRETQIDLQLDDESLSPQVRTQLQKEKISTGTAITRTQAELNALEPEPSRGTEAQNSTTNLLTQARNRASSAQAELDKLRGEEQEIKDLEAEKALIEQRRTQLEAEKREVMGRKRTVDNEVNKSQREYSSAQALRVAQEANFASQLENGLGTAAYQLAMEELNKANQAIDAELSKLKQETADANEKAAYDALASRWLDAARTRKRGVLGRRRIETTRPLNRSAIQADFDTLINQGPDALLRGMMTNRINPTTNAAYTAEEINELMQNEEFKNKIQPEMIKQLLARREKTNGFTQEDIYAISTSQWGQNKLEEARQVNEGIRREMEAVYGAGALNRNGFTERFGQLARQKPWLIALLFGIPVVALGALTMQATAEVINQQS